MSVLHRGELTEHVKGKSPRSMRADVDAAVRACNTFDTRTCRVGMRPCRLARPVPEGAPSA